MHCEVSLHWLPSHSCIGKDVARAWQGCPLGVQDSPGKAARRNHMPSRPLQEGRGGNFSAQIPPTSHFPLAKFHPVRRKSLYFQPLETTKEASSHVP